jgi:hypothetical protein
MRDMQGTAAQKLDLFEKFKARRAFDGEDRAGPSKIKRIADVCGVRGRNGRPNFTLMQARPLERKELRVLTFAAGSTA